MTAFFDRVSEQQRLRDAWAVAEAGRPQLVVLYGRRQVGKTSLVRRVLDQLPRSVCRLYVAATLETSAHAQLARLVQAAQEHDPPIDLVANDWRSALQAVARIAGSRPVVLALDEVPYLETSTPGFGTIVQSFWDELRQRSEPTQFMLILTGSALSTMGQLLSGGGPLFQRADLELAMAPFDLPTAHRFLGEPDPATTIQAYAACGGFPGHLARWRTDADPADNLSTLAFDAYGPLEQSGYRMLVDAPTAGGHRRALDAIGRGLTRHSEIRNEIDQRAEPALDALERSGFVRRSVPTGESPWSKKVRYEIADPFLRFWFRCLYADLQLIEAGQGAAVARRREPEWQKHVGWTFEEEARRHAIRLVQSGGLPPDIVVGRWWSAGSRQLEIDVIGLRGNRTALLGEAKWSDRIVDGRDSRKLRECLDGVPDPIPDPMLVFWTRGQTTPDVRAGAKVFGPLDMVIE